MEIRLDGNDWLLVPLMPHESDWRQVWKEDWDPQKSWPTAGSWIPAVVPGDVISDALDAQLIPHPYHDLQSRACEWLSEREWVYRKRFAVPPEWQGKTLRLRFDGVDYACQVYLNGERLGRHEGMFIPFEHDVTGRLRFERPNTLVVVVEHKPSVDVVQGQIGWTRDARVWKARFAYDWDWCTRLVPLGIWQSVRLLATDAVWIEDLWVGPQVLEDRACVTTRIALRSNAAAGEAEVRLRLDGPDGETRADGFGLVSIPAGGGTAVLSLEIAAPQLWYPNGMGGQPLYRATAAACTSGGGVSDERTATFGIRTVQVWPNEGAPPDALPYTIEVNGRRMFVKGWNWAPIDQMYGRPQRERYERWLTLAKHAHCNLLRVWGGGLLEREEFYDLCDRLGILVWQEFMHSSSGIANAPPTDAAYLEYIEAHARQMIPLRRNHPSLALWCGGNELMYDDWKPLGDEHPALGTLKAVVHELDPDRLWLPTSASGPVENARADLAGTGKMHDVHGPWVYLGAEEHYSFYNTIDPLYHSEFGAEGAANISTLKHFISPKYLFPPDGTNPAWVHHGKWWLHREKLEALFGSLGDLESFVRASQWMQAEGLRYAVESNRRKKWRTSGTSPWQFNESWPNTAGTFAVDYLGQPKPAYWWVRRAYEPAHLSLKYDRLSYRPGEVWKAELWVNNSLDPRIAWRWEAILMSLSGQRLRRYGGIVHLPYNGAVMVTELGKRLPSQPDVFILFVSLAEPSGEAVLSRNEYLFSTAQPPMHPLLDAPRARLDLSRNGDQLRIENTSPVPALFVQLISPTGAWLLPEDDYFCLAPGESRTIRVAGRGEVEVKGWNTD